MASGLLSKKIGFTHARRKDTDFYLHRTLSFSFERIEKPGTKEDIFAKAVVDALRELGGQVDRQGDLLEPVQESLDCKSTMAKRAISEACKQRKIIALPKVKGNSTGYRLAEN